jgi:MtN3 and saliva related transmembrane protein
MAMFINAGLFIPQIVKLVKTKDAGDLSLMTFLGFNFIQLFMALHGLLNNDTLLLTGALISLVTCGSVSILIMKYRFQIKFNYSDQSLP